MPRHARDPETIILKQIMGMPAGAIFLVFMTLQIVCIAGALSIGEFRYLSPQNLTILMKGDPRAWMPSRSEPAY